MSAPIIVPGKKLELGQAMIGPFKVYKRGLGPFLLAMLLPFAAVVVVGVIGVMLGVSTAVAPQTPPAVPVTIFVLTYLAVIVVAGLASLKAHGMIIQGTFDIVQGHRPSFGDLWRRTKGVVGRMLVVYLLMMVALTAFSAVIAAVMILPMVGGLVASGEEWGAAGSAIGMLLGYLLLMVGYVAMVYVGLRLTFLLPEVTVQSKGGIEAAKSSWQLTKGHMLRILGYTLLFSLIVSTIMSALIIVIYAVMGIGLLASINDLENGRFPFGMVITMVIAYILMDAVILLTAPLTTIFSTLLYADRINEGAHTGQAWTSGPGAPHAGPQDPVGPWGQGPHGGDPRGGQPRPGSGYVPAPGYQEPFGVGQPGPQQHYPGANPAPNPAQPRPGQQNPAPNPGQQNPGNQWNAQRPYGGV